MRSFLLTFPLLSLTSLLVAQPYAYVSLAGPSPTYPSSVSSVISEVSTASHSVIGTIGSGPLPTASALSLDGTLVYSVSYFGTSVSEISVATGNLTGSEIGLGFSPLSVSPDPHYPNVVYVGGSDSIAIVDMSSATILQTFPFGAASLAPLSISSTESYIYASVKGSVYWIDAIHRTVLGVINLQQPAGVIAGKLVASSLDRIFVQTINLAGGAQPSPIVTFAPNGSAMQDIPTTQTVRDIAVSPNGKTLYATGGKDVFEWATTGSVVTPIGSFPAGAAPGQIVIAATGSTAYVSDRGNNIEQIELPSGQIESTTGVLGSVRALTLTQDGADLFVSNDSSATNLVPLTPQTGFLYARFSGYDPFTSAVSANAQFVWTSCKSGNGVMVNTGVFPPYSYFYQFAPSHAVFGPDNSTLYVTHSTGTATKPQWAVTALNSTTLAIGNTVNLPAGLVVVGKPVVTPNGKTLFLPASGANTAGIVSISITGNVVTGFIPLAGVSGVAISPNGTTLYAVYNSPSPSVAIINVANKSITSSFSPAVTTNLQFIVVSPDGTRIYAAGTGASSSEVFGVTVADNSNPIYATFPDNGLSGIAVTADGTQLFISDLKSEYAVALNTLTFSQNSTTFQFGYGSDVVIAH